MRVMLRDLEVCSTVKIPGGCPLPDRVMKQLATIAILVFGSKNYIAIDLCCKLIQLPPVSHFAGETTNSWHLILPRCSYSPS